MLADLLVKIGTAGSFETLARSSPYSDKKALADRLIELKADGHAIMADEVFEPDTRTGNIRVFHYSSCVVCRREP